MGRVAASAAHFRVALSQGWFSPPRDIALAPSVCAPLLKLSSSEPPCVVCTAVTSFALLLWFHLRDELCDPFLQVLPSLRRASLHMNPSVPVFRNVQTVLTHYLCSGLSTQQILLVRQDEDGNSREQFLLHQLVQLLRRLVDAPRIGRVDDVDDGVGVRVVILPIRPNVPLAANVPHVQLEARRLHRLDVEALRGRDVRSVLICQLLERSRLA
mmetsp:Transcript_81647/g.162452  ORF Transcript_81647/g.162452 Transcript_81647/m.162452 type:complete len:213 (+) Transcript_81647:413-1051(+)